MRLLLVTKYCAIINIEGRGGVAEVLPVFVLRIGAGHKTNSYYALGGGGAYEEQAKLKGSPDVIRRTNVICPFPGY